MTCMRSLLPFFILLITMSATAATQAPPAFTDYTVHAKSPAQVAKPILATSRDREYRTSIRRAAHDGKVNFAGHYVLSTIGCGSSCLMAFVLDADTGHIAWLPFTVSCAGDIQGIGKEFFPLDFRVDSRLLVIVGSRNERGHGLYHYVLEHGRFRLLRMHEYPSGHTPD